MIDHTLLRANATEGEIKKLCEEAKTFDFKSVCVNSTWVPLCAELLKSSDVLVCTVVGFPLGASPKEVKAFEAELAIKNGAREIDMVINIGKLKDKKNTEVYEDIKAVVDVCKRQNLTSKVIIETCLLTDEEKMTACELSLKAGATFVKTSTGFSTGGATIQDVLLMKKAFNNGDVKASGGVRTVEAMLEMKKAGATRVGTSSGVEVMKGESGKNSY